MSALRFDTVVVEATVKGAVPVATVEVTFEKLGLPAVVTSWFRLYPSTMSAFRFVTFVVEETVNGAVPVATVDVNVEADTPANVGLSVVFRL